MPSIKFILQMVAGSSPAAARSLVFVCHEGQQRLVLEPRRLGSCNLCNPAKGGQNLVRWRCMHWPESNDRSLVLKTRVSSTWARWRCDNSDNILSWFNLVWHRLLKGKESCSGPPDKERNCPHTGGICTLRATPMNRTSIKVHYLASFLWMRVRQLVLFLKAKQL